MADESEAKPAVLAEVPTHITANQVIATVLVLAACKLASGILAPLLVAVLLAVALTPLVAAFSRVMPRWVAAAVVVFGIAAGFAFTVWSLTDDVVKFSKQLPNLIREVGTTIQSASPRQSVLNQLQQAVNELETSATPDTKPTDATPVTIVETTDVSKQVMNYAQTAAGYLGSIILLLFLVYFLLVAGDLFRAKFVKLGGERLSQKKVTVAMLNQMTAQIGQFVFYQFWSGLLVGLLTWVAFAWLGLHYAGLWGLAAGAMNCVPYMGPTIIMLATAAAAMLQFHSLSMVGLVSVASIAITSLEGFILAPIALGKAASVNSVSVFVAVMFWGWMWGALGLVLAVPVLMIIKTVADHVESLAGLSELLSDKAPS